MTEDLNLFTDVSSGELIMGVAVGMQADLSSWQH